MSDPVNSFDMLGLYDYSFEQVKCMINNAYGDLASLDYFDALELMHKRHSTDGMFDFKGHSYDGSDTFNVEGRIMDDDEFGNFIAGYLGYARFGYFGLLSVRVAGHYYGFTDKSDDYLFDDPGSISDIHAGMNAAKNQNWHDDPFSCDRDTMICR